MLLRRELTSGRLLFHVQAGTETVQSLEGESHAITAPIESREPGVLSQAPKPLSPHDEQAHDDQDEEETYSENPDPSPDDYPEDFKEFRDKLKQLLETQMEVKDREVNLLVHKSFRLVR